MKLIILFMLMTGQVFAKDLTDVHLRCQGESLREAVLSASVDNDDVLLRLVKDSGEEFYYRSFHADIAFIKMKKGEAFEVKGHLARVTRGHTNYERVGTLKINKKSSDVLTGQILESTGEVYSVSCLRFDVN